MPTRNDSKKLNRQKPQAMNRLGGREVIGPNVFTLSMGEFLWKVGLLVAATMIAALEEARSKGNELAHWPKSSCLSLGFFFWPKEQTLP